MRASHKVDAVCSRDIAYELLLGNVHAKGFISLFVVGFFLFCGSPWCCPELKLRHVLDRGVTFTGSRACHREVGGDSACFVSCLHPLASEARG